MGLFCQILNQDLNLEAMNALQRCLLLGKIIGKICVYIDFFSETRPQSFCQINARRVLPSKEFKNKKQFFEQVWSWGICAGLFLTWAPAINKFWSGDSLTLGTLASYQTFGVHL